MKEVPVYFLQHIFTSSRTRGGYYTIRISPDLKVFETQLERKGIYKSPAGVFPSRPEEHELEEFPVQFTHYRLEGTGQSVFCRSVYRGRDNHSRAPRYGNYLSHSMVLADDDLPEGLLPFELFEDLPWKNKLELADDVPGSEEVRETIGPISLRLQGKPREYLPRLEALFTSGRKRVNIFLHLVDQIVEGLLQTDKKVIIVEDQPELLPVWVNGLCLVFPPKYFREFSFSSYFRDPLNCHSKIVGTVIQEDNALLYQDQTRLVSIFDVRHEVATPPRNLYTRHIEKVVDLISKGLMQAAGDELSKGFDLIGKKTLGQVGPAFNEPFSFLEDLAKIIIKDDIDLRGDILPLAQKYPSNQQDIEFELLENKPAVYLALLKYYIEHNKYRSFQQIVELTRNREQFTDEHFNDLLEHWSRANGKSETYIDLLSNYFHRLKQPLLIFLYEKALEETIARDDRFDNETNLTKLKNLSDELYNQFRNKDNFKIFFDFKDDLNSLRKYLQAAEPKNKKALLNNLGNLIVNWRTVLRDFPNRDRELVGWWREVNQLFQEQPVTFDVSDVEQPLAETLEDFFQKYRMWPEVANLEKLIDIDIKLVQIRYLFTDWTTNKNQIGKHFHAMLDPAQRHKILQWLNENKNIQSELILDYYQILLQNESQHPYNQDKFFKDYVEAYKLEKLPFVELYIKSQIQKRNGEIIRREAEAARHILRDPFLDKTSAPFLCRKAEYLVKNNINLGDKDFYFTLIELNDRYDLNIELPIIQYYKAAKRLAYKDKDELYDAEGLESFILEHKSTEPKTGDLVINILNRIVKDRYNFEDFLQLFYVFNKTEILPNDYFSAIVKYIDSYYNSFPRIGTRDWLKEQFIIAVLLSKQDELFKLLQEYFDFDDIFNDSSDLYVRHNEARNRIAYYVRNQTRDLTLLDQFLKGKKEKKIYGRAKHR